MDAYASHLPVLRALGKALPIEAVLEFGCGKYSTLEFLNRASFSRLEKLISYERSKEWIALVQGMTVDPRLELRYCTHTYFQVIWGGTVGYDLIFIDDGENEFERISTIDAVATARPGCPIVIHDFEHTPYQEAAREFDHIRVFTGLMPHTAICWFGHKPELEVVLNGLHLEA